MNSIQKTGTLVIGAGVIGSAVAMSLARRGVQGVRVIDFDLEGSLSSSELNAGGVRATWNQPINIAMSRITIDYLASVADEVGYRACGYLWLHGEERLKGALAARERQAAAGWAVEAWDVAELRRKVPLIDKTDGIAGAIFSPRDGLVNPNLLKNHFRAKARESGAVFEDRVWLTGCEYDRASGSAGSARVRLTAKRLRSALSQDDKEVVLSRGIEGLETETIQFEADRVINCAGPWAAQVARILGYESPCYAVRRQVSIFDCREVDLNRYGMIVDTSGVYFHPEAMNGLSGFAVPGEARGINYHSEGESFFMEHIWPALYERSSSFEKLKYLTGWAGQYEVSPDESAVIGKVENGEPGASGAVFEAHSFSGQGVMHSYSAGEALAELITQGRSESVELEQLSGSRFETGRLVHESQVI